MNFSTTEENYIKAIFHLQSLEGTVTTNALAQKLQTRPASVTDMMKKLSAKKILNYKPYYGFTLSSEGKRIAITIIRRHRLWEFFLAEKLQFGWDEVHPLAEELEHVSSSKLIDKLDAYLGFPQFDPHGDPIPDSRGKMAVADHTRLTTLQLNQPAVVVRVSNQSKQMLDELAEKNITIGTSVEIRKRSDFDQALTVRVRNRNIVLTEQVAQHLLVKKLQHGTD
ncbi:MAG TPA: metal-dependent transcriptional regulator [Flavisolibacter sp.]